MPKYQLAREATHWEYLLPVVEASGPDEAFEKLRALNVKTPEVQKSVRIGPDGFGDAWLHLIPEPTSD